MCNTKIIIFPKVLLKSLNIILPGRKKKKMYKDGVKEMVLLKIIVIPILRSYEILVCNGLTKWMSTLNKEEKINFLKNFKNARPTLKLIKMDKLELKTEKIVL